MDQRRPSLTVQDTGEGIPPAELERMFVPFAYPEPGRRAGAGLGVDVARPERRAAGGARTLRSEPGAGTLATVRFPASRLVDPTGKA